MSKPNVTDGVISTAVATTFLGTGLLGRNETRKTSHLAYDLFSNALISSVCVSQGGGIVANTVNGIITGAVVGAVLSETSN